VGTGKLTEKEEGRPWSGREHDFAVLDMKEVGEHRLALVKTLVKRYHLEGVVTWK
jgi:hypothetical protein